MIEPGARKTVAVIAAAGVVFAAGYLLGHRGAAPSPPGERGADIAPAPVRRSVRPAPAPAPAMDTVDRPPPEPAPPPPSLAAFRVEAPLPYRGEADDRSAVVGTIPAGTTVEILEQRSAYQRASFLVDGVVVVGWILTPPGHDPEPDAETGTIEGLVRFTGQKPVMQVPKKVATSEYCKAHPVLSNAVLGDPGRLEDVFVRIAPGSFELERAFKAPARDVIVDQVDCMYTPRIQGAMIGQTLRIRNADGTLHDVHGYLGAASWLNKAQPKGSAPLDVPLGEGDRPLIKLTCDVHPWMRGFVVVSEHPFFAVSGADGTFAIHGVPPGSYRLEAWHARYGRKKASAKVVREGVVRVEIAYDGTEEEPPQNADEMKELF